MQPKFNLSNDYIVKKLQSVQVIDIETSLVDARVYRPGAQFVGAHQLNNFTSLLTVAGGTLYDLYTKGAEGVWSFGNHMDLKAFKKNPLDDTFVLRRIWDVLDKADVIIAHNANFDKSWILGRFLQLGWKLPSKFSVVCSYKGLSRYNFTSKKLDFLSKQLLGTRKIATDFSLWDRCSNGELAAFEEMMEYNIGDIHDTLYQVYLKTCSYYPDYAVDLVDYSAMTPMCKVDGGKLESAGHWVNRLNGLEYKLFTNKRLGITYRDRYNSRSKKSGCGYIRHHI